MYIHIIGIAAASTTCSLILYMIERWKTKPDELSDLHKDVGLKLTDLKQGYSFSSFDETLRKQKERSLHDSNHVDDGMCTYSGRKENVPAELMAAYLKKEKQKLELWQPKNLKTIGTNTTADLNIKENDLRKFAQLGVLGELKPVSTSIMVQTNKSDFGGLKYKRRGSASLGALQKKKRFSRSQQNTLIGRVRRNVKDFRRRIGRTSWMGVSDFESASPSEESFYSADSESIIDSAPKKSNKYTKQIFELLANLPNINVSQKKSLSRESLAASYATADLGFKSHNYS